MDQHTVSISTQSFILRPDVDVERLQHQLTELVQHGGGMIDLPAVGPDRIRVLVSPGLPVVFHTHQLPDDDSSVDENDAWVSMYAGEADFYFA